MQKPCELHPPCRPGVWASPLCAAPQSYLTLVGVKRVPLVQGCSSPCSYTSSRLFALVFSVHCWYGNRLPWHCPYGPKVFAPVCCALQSPHEDASAACTSAGA